MTPVVNDSPDLPEPVFEQDEDDTNVFNFQDDDVDYGDDYFELDLEERKLKID